MLWYVKPKEEDIQHALVGAAAGVNAVNASKNKNAILQTLKTKLNKTPYKKTGDILQDVKIITIDSAHNRVRCTATYKTPGVKVPVTITQWVSLK